MNSLKYYKKLLTVIIFYDYSYDTKKSLSLFSSDLSFARLSIRFLAIILALPLALLAWIILRVIFFQYKVSIYVLKTFRPGWASTYLNMMEPLCRQIQQENNSRHIKILIEPGNAVSEILVKSYTPHFTMYLDDRRKFMRLIAFLIPKSGLEKKFINTSDKYLESWLYPPSINYANLENQVPSDLARMGIEKENYVIFAHPSRNYYRNRLTSSQLQDIELRFFDLSTYSQALKKIIENNLKVVRVGVQVDELPIEFKAIPLLDYTGAIRNEASELWLYENCRFLVSVCNGAFWFARRFERPSIVTNSYGLYAGYLPTLYTLMTLRSKKSGNLLSFANMLELRKKPGFLSYQFMNNHSLELLPNSSLTIVNAINDVFNLLDQKQISSQEDNELMDRYRALLGEFGIPVAEKMTLPAISFLKEYKHLL